MRNRSLKDNFSTIKHVIQELHQNAKKHTKTPGIRWGFFLILAYQQKTLSFTPSLKNLDQIWRGKMPTHGSAVLHFYKMPRLLVTRPSSAQKPWPKKGKIKNRTDHGKKLILSVECSHIFYQIFPFHHLKLLKFKHRAVGRGIKC